MSKKRSKSIQATKTEAGIEIIAVIVGLLGIIISIGVGVFGVGANAVITGWWLSQHPNFWTTAAIIVGGLFLLITIFFLGVRLKNAISSRNIPDDEPPNLLCPKGGFHKWQIDNSDKNINRQICKKCGTTADKDGSMSIRKKSKLSTTQWVAIGGIGAALVTGIAAVIVAIIQKSPEPSPTSIPPGYVDIVKDLQLSPNLTSDDVHHIFKVGEIVTATLEIQNTGITPVTIERFNVSVRGPDACDKGWGDYVYDFQGVGIILLPSQTYSYTQSLSFSKPGVYFAEPTAKLPGRKWGGVPPFQRIYFFVIDPTNNSLPISPCVTPVPKTP